MTEIISFFVIPVLFKKNEERSRIYKNRNEQ